jgi:hypothetical protein
MHAYIHTHTYIYINTYIHTYIHARWNIILLVCCRGKESTDISDLYTVSRVSRDLITRIYVAQFYFNSCILESWPVSAAAWVCGCALAGIVGLNTAVGMDVRRECCVLSYRGLGVGLITRPEKSYRVWCVKLMWSRSPVKGGHDPESGRCATEKILWLRLLDRVETRLLCFSDNSGSIFGCKEKRPFC